MKFWSDSFCDGDRIPQEFAFGKWNEETKIELSENKNPHFSWSDLPEGTKSLALVCCDPDVPSRGDDVNQEGRVVPASLPRVDFFHWALIDIPVDQNEISVGEYCDGVTAKGKSGPESLRGARHGVNNYTQWFEGDESMAGLYFGYDGPCPPWNDEITHHYQFTFYALSVERSPLEGNFPASSVPDAIKGAVLAQETITGLYAINPEAK